EGDPNNDQAAATAADSDASSESAPAADLSELAPLAQWLLDPKAPCFVSLEEAPRVFNVADRNKSQQLLRAVDTHRVTSPAAPPRAMVLVDKEHPVQPHIFVRGNPARRGDAVPRRFLAVLSADGEPK